MKPVRFFVVKSTSFRRANGSAVVCRLGAKMCKELKTKFLHLLPSTSNGSTTHQELQTDGTEILSCTVKALKDGHVVAVPTDTIYGLACLAQNSEAVQKIYNLKERNGGKPLAICVGEIQEIYNNPHIKQVFSDSGEENSLLTGRNLRRILAQYKQPSSTTHWGSRR